MKDIVQIRNPKTNRYTKIDRSTGMILSCKISPGPYKGIPIARRRIRKIQSPPKVGNISRSDARKAVREVMAMRNYRKV